MRGLCKEEDYAFLGMSKETTKGPAEGAETLEDDWRGKKEERVRDKGGAKTYDSYTPTSIHMCLCAFQARWRLEREQREKERLRLIEEGRKVNTHIHTCG